MHLMTIAHVIPVPLKAMERLDKSSCVNAAFFSAFLCIPLYYYSSICFCKRNDSNFLFYVWLGMIPNPKYVIFLCLFFYFLLTSSTALSSFYSSVMWHDVCVLGMLFDCTMFIIWLFLTVTREPTSYLNLPHRFHCISTSFLWVSHYKKPRGE